MPIERGGAAPLPTLTVWVKQSDGTRCIVCNLEPRVEDEIDEAVHTAREIAKEVRGMVEIHQPRARIP